MLDFIKKLFIKTEKTESLTARELFVDDKEDILEYNPKDPNNIDKWNISLPKDFSKDKDTILIIDDNIGMVSFLIDDIEYFKEEGIIDNDINIISIHSSHAVFKYEALQEKYNNLNIKWAIIDITFGGSVMSKDGNIIYTGVDVYKILKEHNKNFKFLFYTGNNLNPYIRSNSILIDKFKELSDGKDIMEDVLFKTSMDMDNRRKYIKDKLFASTKKKEEKH